MGICGGQCACRESRLRQRLRVVNLRAVGSPQGHLLRRHGQLVAAGSGVIIGIAGTYVHGQRTFGHIGDGRSRLAPSARSAVLNLGNRTI